MHRHRNFRHGQRHFRGPFFPGLFWLFIFVMIFSKGHWWPGILVLIGLSIIFNSFFKDSAPQETQNPPPPVVQMPPPTPPTMAAAAPVEQTHRSDLLPLTCPQCGGPIRSYEVKWTGKQSAVCPYCGSNLPMKKS
jgi:hypothetical protein